jgi:8-oxo-dGTP diphosphatase
MEYVGIIIEKDGRILLQHRDDIPTIKYPGMWDTWGGEIERGETPRQAAIRELEEEIGIKLKPEEMNLLCKVKLLGSMHYFFYAKYKGDDKDLDLKEGQAFGYFFPREIKDLPMVKEFYALLMQILQHEQQG